MLTYSLYRKRKAYLRSSRCTVGMLPENLPELELKLCFPQAGLILLEVSSGEGTCLLIYPLELFETKNFLC